MFWGFSPHHGCSVSLRNLSSNPSNESSCFFPPGRPAVSVEELAGAHAFSLLPLALRFRREGKQLGRRYPRARPPALAGGDPRGTADRRAHEQHGRLPHRGQAGRIAAARRQVGGLAGAAVAAARSPVGRVLGDAVLPRPLQPDSLSPSGYGIHWRGVTPWEKAARLRCGRVGLAALLPGTLPTCPPSPPVVGGRRAAGNARPAPRRPCGPHWAARGHGSGRGSRSPFAALLRRVASPE